MMVAMVMNCYCVVMMLITVDSNGLPQKEEFNFMILFSRFSCILPMAMEYVKANLRMKILWSVKSLQIFKITAHMLCIIL